MERKWVLRSQVSSTRILVGIVGAELTVPFPEASRGYRGSSGGVVSNLLVESDSWEEVEWE